MSTTPDWRTHFAELAKDHPQDVADVALALVDRLHRLFPDLTPSTKPGWRAVTFRHSRAGFVCAVFLAHKGKITLVFEHGSEMSDPEDLLEGKTRQVRHIAFPPARPISDEILSVYVAEAVALRS